MEKLLVFNWDKVAKFMYWLVKIFYSVTLNLILHYYIEKVF